MRTCLKSHHTTSQTFSLTQEEENVSSVIMSGKTQVTFFTLSWRPKHMCGSGRRCGARDSAGEGDAR